MTPPVIRHKAEALLKSWGFEPGVRRKWYEDDFNDKMLEKYGNDYYDLFRYPAEQRDEAINELITPVEREAARLLSEFPEQRKSSLRLSDALAIYLETHRKGRDPRYIAATNRAVAHVYSSVQIRTQ